MSSVPLADVVSRFHYGLDNEEIFAIAHRIALEFSPRVRDLHNRSVVPDQRERPIRRSSGLLNRVSWRSSGNSAGARELVR